MSKKPWSGTSDAERIAMIANMQKLANDYEASACILSEKAHPCHGPATSQLGILALEIRLKCAALIDSGTRPLSHDYCKIWKSLKQDTQAKLLRLAEERYAGHICLSNLEEIFAGLKLAFEIGRYDYERNDSRSPDVAKKVGKEWLENGAKVEDADISYYPYEVEALNFALFEWLKNQP